MNLKNYLLKPGFFLLTLFFLGFSPGSQAQEPESLFRASRIMDQDVYDKQQKLIGEVDDIIIRRSGKVKKLIVEFGGFLGIGDKLVDLSFKRFKMKNGGVALEETLQELEERPEFDYYSHGLSPDYYYRLRAYKGPYHYPYPSYYYGPNAPNPMNPYEDAFSPSHFLASTIMDRRLVNEEGEDIGRIKDLLINRKSNNVEKIILSSIDILENDIHVVLPYEPLGFSAYGLIYDIMPGELKDFIYPYKE